MADRAGRPDDGRNGEHNQRQNLQRRQEVTHGIQQFARIERDQNDNGKIDHAVDKQRHGRIAGQRGDPHFKRDRRGARRGE